VAASTTTIVVPCFNEAARLRPEGFRPLAEHPDVRLVFVNDGSSDDTAAVLRGLAERWPASVSAVDLPANAGKAEAVRQGLLAAVEARPPAFVGYLDADLATPAEEMLRLREVIVESGARAVLGARVALLGRDIRRSQARHYLGRIFATAASAVLRLPVYDTQCGAKLFRVDAALLAAISEPFHSRWAFDIELIGRILPRDGEPAGIVEVPLEVWHDVKGSTLRLPQMVRAGVEIGRIGVELARWRRRR
jgi:dolichyl-phosphate beta-glucosyltransferase